MIDIRISTLDGIELVHAMNKYTSAEKSAFKKGKNNMHCILENHLQPGKYSFTIGIHKTDGTTLEYVENILDFNVLNITDNEKEGFLYDYKLGHVRFESQWKIEN